MMSTGDNTATHFSPQNTGTLKNSKVVQLVEQIRSFGHTLAHINPMEDAANGQSLLEKAMNELSDADLKAIPAKQYGKMHQKVFTLHLM